MTWRASSSVCPLRCSYSNQETSVILGSRVDNQDTISSFSMVISRVSKAKQRLIRLLTVVLLWGRWWFRVLTWRWWNSGWAWSLRRRVSRSEGCARMRWPFWTVLCKIPGSFGCLKLIEKTKEVWLLSDKIIHGIGTAWYADWGKVSRHSSEMRVHLNEDKVTYCATWAVTGYNLWDTKWTSRATRILRNDKLGLVQHVVTGSGRLETFVWCYEEVRSDNRSWAQQLRTLFSLSWDKDSPGSLVFCWIIDSTFCQESGRGKIFIASLIKNTS